MTLAALKAADGGRTVNNNNKIWYPCCQVCHWEIRKNAINCVWKPVNAEQHCMSYYGSILFICRLLLMRNSLTQPCIGWAVAEVLKNEHPSFYGSIVHGIVPQSAAQRPIMHSISPLNVTWNAHIIFESSVVNFNTFTINSTHLAVLVVSCCISSQLTSICQIRKDNLEKATYRMATSGTLQV